MTKIFTGKDLIAWGIPPGPYYKDAIRYANIAAETGQDPEIAARSAIPEPPESIPLNRVGSVPINMLIDGDTQAELDNIAAVRRTLEVIARVPTVIGLAAMPDACPAGPVGTIPVGGVAVCRDAIHPGFHSADICCSVYASYLSSVNPRKVLDLAMELTHFGGGGRKERLPAPYDIIKKFKDNVFLRGLEDVAHHHFGTQGDGNHFFYVGRDREERPTIVTHHGSRKLGAMLYKRGMEAAIEYTKPRCPDIDSFNSWLSMDTEEGAEYWDALQIVREWTKENHAIIHTMVARAAGADIEWTHWNEHNFVFHRGGLRYYHGKGATPSWGYHADDSIGLVLIPLNMAEPILVIPCGNSVNSDSFGFAPHGAGRNFGRMAHIRSLGDVDVAARVAEETKGLYVRFWTGDPDLSELPSAYKNAASVISQMEKYDMASSHDKIYPVGCIMAGNWKKGD